MSKARAIVLSVVVHCLTKAEAARRYDVSWQWVHTLVTRYHTGGPRPSSHDPDDHCPTENHVRRGARSSIIHAWPP